MKKIEETYYEVTIKCLVKDKDINGRAVDIAKVKQSLSLYFDQIDHTELTIEVK